MKPSTASALPFLQAKSLAREFDGGHVKALRGVRFSIQEGEFVAITAPSGCGKSTLPQLLGALDRPTAGELLYRGKPVPDNPDPASYRASEVGFIFQAFHLVADNWLGRLVSLPCSTNLSMACITVTRACRTPSSHDTLPNSTQEPPRNACHFAATAMPFKIWRKTSPNPRVGAQWREATIRATRDLANAG